MTSSTPGGKPDCKVARSPLVYKGHVYHPYIKNMMIGGGLMVLGEICAQSIKMYFRSPPGSDSNSGAKFCPSSSQSPPKVRDPEKSWMSHISDTGSYNLNSVIRQGVIGSFQGFYQFIYYSWLDKVFSGVSVTIVAKKVILDEVLIGPISLVIFFLYNGFCDTYSMAGAVKRCRQSFLSGYLSDLVYWPILQTVNFALVPPAYRVLYVIFFTSLWDTYLCLINTRMSCSGPQKNENEEKVTTVET
ncbi:Mpv17-like protein 2 [Schistosoma japonicum]|nr:Mpv17-like protein 2 [Schistosoma japonicum]KAH8874133.1 Mpv17-like protein 2 [Schistosoma japonicum]KAH8874134.1 Mpv17-like protein 2 [Schistosoma japonicum]KAH8874135.1 Mpv17-like protein 2 [Schistosoma japonicum]